MIEMRIVIFRKTETWEIEGLGDEVPQKQFFLAIKIRFYS